MNDNFKSGILLTNPATIPEVKTVLTSLRPHPVASTTSKNFVPKCYEAKWYML